MMTLLRNGKYRDFGLKVVYGVFVTAALFLLFKDWLYDDPFITFRYARNIAAGNGFVYNAGLPVLSTTTPLYALYLSIFARPGFPLETVANLTSAISITAGALAINEIGSRIGQSVNSRRMIGLAGLLFYPTFPLVIQTFSSETPVYLALCLAAILAYLNDRHTLTGLLLGLAVLTRADAAVLAVVLGFDWLIFRRRIKPALPWKLAAAFIAVLLPWIIFGYSTFGSPIPSTLAAKQAQALLAGSESFALGLKQLAAAYAKSSPHYVALAGLFLAGLLTLTRKGEGRLIFVLWPLLYTLGYIYLGVTRYFWYFAPIIPGMIVCAGFGLEMIDDVLRKSTSRYLPQVFAFFILLLFARQATDLVNLRRFRDTRIEIYRAAGEWLSENTPEDASIGTVEVGIIGYYAAPRPLIDFAGLIEPEIAGQFTEGYSYAQAAIWAAERYEPDYLVLIEGHFAGLLESYGEQRCSLAHSLAGEAYGYAGNILIYECP